LSDLIYSSLRFSSSDDGCMQLSRKLCNPTHARTKVRLLEKAFIYSVSVKK